MFAKKKQSGAQFRHAAETVAANQKAAMILKQTEEKYQKEIDSLKHRALKAEKDASDVASQASKASADALAAQERGASMEVSLEEARKRGDVLADNVRLLRLELEEKTERLSEAEVELERLQAACEKATAWKMQLKTAFREKDRHIVDLASELQVELSEMMRKVRTYLHSRPVVTTIFLTNTRTWNHFLYGYVQQIFFPDTCNLRYYRSLRTHETNQPTYPTYQPYIHSLIHSLIHSFIHSFIHSYNIARRHPKMEAWMSHWIQRIQQEERGR